MSRDFDFIATGVPLNRTAAAVLRHGEHYDRMDGNTTAHHSSAPPPMKRFTGQEEHDMTGHSFGLFTVIGWARDVENSWVCRCQCGDYELRKTKSVRNPANSEDRCIKCRDLAYLKKHAAWIAQGRPEHA